MMITVFLKSTVRPWPSVRRPSSRICSSVLKTSGCAFLDFVEQHHRIGPAAHMLGQLAAFVVADVSGRRADHARHGVLLHVLGHIDAHHGFIVVEHELGERSAPVRSCRRRSGPRKMKLPMGRLGSLRPARLRRMALATSDTASFWPITRSCSRSSMWISFWTSPSSMRATGMPVHLATILAISSSSISSLRSAVPDLMASRSWFGGFEMLLDLGQLAVA